MSQWLKVITVRKALIANVYGKEMNASHVFLEWIRRAYGFNLFKYQWSITIWSILSSAFDEEYGKHYSQSVPPNGIWELLRWAS